MTNKRDPGNANRIDVYRRLLPHIQEEDQASGAHGYVFHWDDPEAKWDAIETGDFRAVWDAIGLSPVIQELCFVVEKMEEDDIVTLESLDALTDPVRCPASLLPDLATSLGYKLAESLTEAQQRMALLGLVNAFKSRGTWIGFKVFYRAIGFEIITVYPLYKQSINEAGGNYSRVPFVGAAFPAVTIGPSGHTTYQGTLPDVPIIPGSLRINCGGGIVIRDDGPPNPSANRIENNGTLIGPTTERGTINYRTGKYTLTLAAPAASAPIATGTQITETWPFPAARIDIDILLSPGGKPIPLIDATVVGNLLSRMEETRPIHVLLRNIALVAEIDDTFGADNQSGATDRTACQQLVLDHRDGLAFPAFNGRDYLYIIDLGTDAQDGLTIEHASGGPQQVDIVFEDFAEIVCPLDSLVIAQIPGAGPPTVTYW